MAGSGSALRLELSQSLAPVIGAVIGRVKHLFDLSAVPDAVTSLLSQDPLLRASVERLPGLRVPGAFDGFELGVRAILGQQVSVKSATTVAGRWAHAFGERIDTPFPDLDRLTPGPLRMAEMSEDDIAVLGVVGSRARCIVNLARAVNERRVVLSFAVNVEAQIESLLKLPGIGPWTANYIAMRALHWPDAFPDGDIMLLKAANLGRKQLLAHAEHWRPWRAYATHYLWQSLGAFP
jgi:AraC family transcriptional regulator of adaptative response / DNA-3-methyladenine glycosylase II